jgi:HSP20 family protein
MEPRFDWKEPWDSVSDAMSKVLDDFGTIAEETFVHVACRPSVALRGSATAYELEVSVPGVARDDVDISVEGRRVTIAGAWPKADIDDDRTVLRDELARGRFKRVVLLPDPVEASGVSARLAAGILTVTLPLREPAERTEIPIEDADVPEEGPASTTA